MLRLINKMFIVLLSNLVNGSNHTKCVSLSNQKSMTQPTIIHLHPNEKVKNFTIIHLLLNQIYVLEVAILLMICLIKQMFQIKQKI